MKSLCIFLLVTSVAFALADDSAPPLSAEEMAAINEEASADLAACDKALAENPKLIPAYSMRGDAHLFLGDYAKARADFEKMIELDPAQDAPHWRLGIAYFFLGDYKKGAAQFERYHAYDDHDRENGVWHYFCLAKVEGVEKAREKMLIYTKFDRHPFPSLYEMFAGKKTPADVSQEIEQADVDDDERDRRRFFAELYIAFERWLADDRPAAASHAEKATANRWGKELSGKTYMWQVARLAALEWKKPATIR